MNWHNEVFEEMGWFGKLRCQAPECYSLEFSNLQVWFDHCDEQHPVEQSKEMSWRDKLRQRKIENGDICGGCGEWPEYCGCPGCNCCKASISGICLAITHNVSYCEPQCCGKMDGEQQAEDGV